MRAQTLLVALIIGTQGSAHAAQFTRTGAAVVRMEGAIASGDAARFALVYDEAVWLLKVNSEGGDLVAGMELGRLIRGHRLDLEIAGVCASSCANYLFPAARRKLIPRGSILAFHGTAYTSSLSSPEKMRRMLLAAGVPVDQLAAAVPGTIAELKQQAVKEREFAEQLHIDPSFYQDFLRVATVYNAAFPGEAGKSISVLWWPSAQRLLACYGIARVHDRARPTVLARGGRYYEDEFSSMIVGDRGLDTCPRTDRERPGRSASPRAVLT